MSKAILVIEKHEHCIDCPLLDSEYGTCVVTGGYVERMIRKEDRREIPCPLKPLPQKKDTHGRYIDNQYIETAYEVGWNDCIDEILREEE